MLEYVTPFEDLVKEAGKIQRFLDESLDDGLVRDNPELVEEHGFKLASYVSRTGKMKADAEHWLSAREGLDIVIKVKHLLTQIPTASANVQNAVIKTVCRDERHLVTWCERLNRTATHQLDWCRSVLSYEKEERRMSNFQRA